FSERIRFPEILRVVFQRFPADDEQVAAGALDGALHLVVDEASGFGDDRRDAAVNGFFEGFAAGGVDAEVGDFSDHVKAPLSWGSGCSMQAVIPASCIVPQSFPAPHETRPPAVSQR